MPGHLKGLSGPFRLHTRRASGINKQLETEACFQMTIEKNRHESNGYLLNGGDERIRTADPLLAKQVLSQRSKFSAQPTPRGHMVLYSDPISVGNPFCVPEIRYVYPVYKYVKYIPFRYIAEFIRHP